MKSLMQWALAVIVMVPIAKVHAAPPPGVRGAFVEEIRNDSGPLAVRVAVNHENLVYAIGDELKLSAQASFDGYLYVLYGQAGGKITCLFPNHIQTDNAVKASEQIHVPPRENAKFRIRIGRPLGDEYVKVVVTKRPLKSLDIDRLKQGLTLLSLSEVKAAYLEDLRGREKEWAEHCVRIRTVEKQTAAVAPKKRRIGLFVGINRHLDATIPALLVCENDCDYVARIMRSAGQLDEAIILKGSEATLANLREAFAALAKNTSPGDEIFIYYSGHGARAADVDGDEADRYDEVLVTYDTDRRRLAATGLLDDVFARWLQDLDGRRIAIILDTCHSGGAIKSLNLREDEDRTLGFLDNELRRIKSVGQQRIALLASAHDNQLAFERAEGDLSVMTALAGEEIVAARQSLSLKMLHDRITVRVQTYVANRYPGATQIPLLIDAVSPPILIRP